MMSHNKAGKRSRKQSKTPQPEETESLPKRRRTTSGSPASSSSRRSSTPNFENWERLPEFIEHKPAAGKLVLPSDEQKEDAKELIAKLKYDSFVKRKYQGSVRLDKQGSTGDGFTNLQIQTNKTKKKTESKSIACVLVQDQCKFENEWIQFALRKSLDTGKNCRLRAE